MYSGLKNLIEKDMSLGRRTLYNNLVKRKRSFAFFDFLDRNINVLSLRTILALVWAGWRVLRSEAMVVDGVLRLKGSSNEEKVFKAFDKEILGTTGNSKVERLFPNFKKLKIVARIVARVSTRCPLFVTFRAAEFMALYSAVVRRQHNVCAYMAASSFTPNAAAVLLAGRKKGVKTIFVANGLDTSPFFDQKVEIMIAGCPYNLKDNKKAKLKIAHSLGGIESKAMQIKEVKKIGIFLSGNLNMAALLKLVAQLKEANFEVLIREHPNQEFKLKDCEIRALIAGQSKILITSLDQALELCDLVIAGNSSVHVDCLSRGVPTIYHALLDEDERDLFGFLGNNIVMEYALEKINKKHLEGFFLDVDWSLRFQLYQQVPMTTEFKENVRKEIFKC